MNLADKSEYLLNMLFCPQILSLHHHLHHPAVAHYHPHQLKVEEKLVPYLLHQSEVLVVLHRLLHPAVSLLLHFLAHQQHHHGVLAVVHLLPHLHLLRQLLYNKWVVVPHHLHHLV